MKEVVYERQEEMIAWAEEHIPGNRFRDDAKAIGVRSNGGYSAVAVFDAFTTTGCWISIASDGRGRWLTREFIIKVFAFPFIQCGYPRLSAFIAKSNEPSLKLCEGFGFEREGIMREGAEDGGDLILLGMLRRNCRWLPETFAGKVPSNSL